MIERHIDVINKANRTLDVRLIKLDSRYQSLRKELIEDNKNDFVAKVEMGAIR